ncbi:MAG: potassium channel family protein [bacterium]|nr:potassium channel family protein [bacterium]
MTNIDQPSQNLPNNNTKNSEKQSSGLKTFLRKLYFEDKPISSAFRYSMLVFDIFAVSFFIYLSLSDHASEWFRPIEIFIGIVVLLDFLSRYHLAHRKWRYLLQLTTIADIIVLFSLFIPTFIDNYAFLRILRALRILRSKHIMDDLRGQSRFLRRNEEVIQSLVNLVVFIFIMTSIVFELQVRINPDINNHIDALYFTVSTLTTTGYGDITIKGTYGRLLSVFIMVLGASLFLRLLQTLFRPPKISVRCEECGLNRHEPDASHCKHCGTIVHIKTGGE